MEYRLGTLEDLDNICNMISEAIDNMEYNGIHQWDELYPARYDFEEDIRNNTLYTVSDDNGLVAIYVISKECDEEYDKCIWEMDRDSACIIHRLCVSPKASNKGIGKAVLIHIEKQLKKLGFESVRLDVFSENPYALKLYEHNGYVKRGHADWRKGRFYLMEKGLSN